MTDKEQYKFIYFNKSTGEVILRIKPKPEYKFITSLTEFLPFTEDSLSLFSMLHPDLVKFHELIRECLNKWGRGVRFEYKDPYYTVSRVRYGDGEESLQIC